MDLNYCTYCDKAVSPFSESLYCGEECFRSDGVASPRVAEDLQPSFSRRAGSSYTSLPLRTSGSSNSSSGSSSPPLSPVSPVSPLSPYRVSSHRIFSSPTSITLTMPRGNRQSSYFGSNSSSR